MDDEVEQATAALATQETLARELVASAQQHRKNAEAAKLRVQAAKLAQDAELAKWAPKQQEVRKEITLAEQAGVQAAAARRRADAIRQKMKGIDERKATLQARGVEIATESDKLKADKLHLEFWAKGFSNAGLPSHMMDAIMPALTDRANHYLGILADGDINISFDTQSKLKSGEAREKISINWIIEGEADTTPSGGQRKKISIAVDLALMDIVATRERASIDILLIDELLDGLDRTGRQRIMSLLSELRQQRSTILVISHDSDITELFENTLIVRKEARKAELLAV
jgi:DNA repair exonuclease SbcCD ATPase subunit